MQHRKARRARRSVRPAGHRADRSRRDERRRRALQGGRETQDQGAARPRGLLRGRSHRARPQGRAQPPDVARGDQRGLQEPHDALQQGLSRGPAPRQARGGPRTAVPARRGRHLPHGLPRRAHEPADHRRQARGRPHAPRRADPDFWARGRLSRGAEERAGRAGAGQRRDEALRAGDRALARRHGRRALPAPGGLPSPRGAAVRADQVHARRAEDVLQHERVLL